MVQHRKLCFGMQINFKTHCPEPDKRSRYQTTADQHRSFVSDKKSQSQL